MAETKKKLVVNTGFCDAREVSEEMLAQYAGVEINSGLVLTTEESRALMGRYAVQMSTGQVIGVPSGIPFAMVNGSMRFAPGQAVPEGKRGMFLNGSLDIEEGSEAVLESYASIIVNGSVCVPESMAGMLSAVSVNGSTEVYPDGAIRLSAKETLDRTFHLRARQGALYYARKQITALTPDIDFSAMAAKDVRFKTKKLIIAESLVEAAMPLFDEQTKIFIVPDGCVLIEEDNFTLDAQAVEYRGGKLLVNGDVWIPEAGPWLDLLSFLWVSGCVRAVRGAVRRLAAIGAKYDELRIVGGTLLKDRGDICVTRAMLEKAADGLSLDSCGQVSFEEDIPASLLKEKLVSLWDCARVVCTPEQQEVIETLAHDVGEIGRKGAPAEEPEAEETPEQETEPVETVYVKSGSYVL